MCDQDHFEEDREQFEALGLVTRKQFGVMLGAGMAMLLPQVANAVTVVESDVSVTTPDGTTVTATSTGPDTYGAQLPDGRFVTGNADGTTTITAQDGATTNYSAAGQPTGSAPPSLESGGGVDTPPLHHSVRTATDDGGYTVSHPDGTVDVHHADGSAIHVEADGSTWRPIP